MTDVQFTPEQVTKALMMLVAHAGNIPDTQKALTRAGLTIRHDRLQSWMTTVHRDEFERLREKHADELEGQLAKECRDIAALSMKLQRVALEKAERKLNAGEDKDPAKTAVMASGVAKSAVDKLMTLTNRDAKVTDPRTPEEIIRSLIAREVLKPLPQQIEGTGEEVTDG